MISQRVRFHRFFLAIVIIAMFVDNPIAFATIRLLTFHYNRPDFIELQHKTLQKFMQEDYELIVINDGNTPERAQAIRLTCEQYGIRCVRFEQHWHFTDCLNDQVLSWLYDPAFIHTHLSFWTQDWHGVLNQPSVRHCHAIQYALDHFGYGHDDIVAILDGDIFPIRPISLKTLLKDVPIAGIRRTVAEENLEYLWVPFIAFDQSRLPNIHDLKFNVAFIEGHIHDSGAESYYYLKNNPGVNVKMYDYHGSTYYFDKPISVMEAQGFNYHEIELIKSLPWPQCVEFHVNFSFLHFCGSSFGLVGHEEKATCVKEFIEKIIAIEDVQSKYPVEENAWEENGESDENVECEQNNGTLPIDSCKNLFKQVLK